MEAISTSINRWTSAEDVVYTYNGILLGHKKQQNWVICSDADEPRVCHTEWSKSEKISCINAHIWNPQKWCSSVQSLSRVRLYAPPLPAAHQSSQSVTNSQSLYKLVSIKSVMPSNHLLLCHPLLLLPSVFPSIRVSSNESVLCIRWPKYWSFSFNISPSSEYSGLISFRMDWLNLLAVQGTLKSLLQHHSSKASILWCSAFFMVQLSHPYMTTGKTIALTRWTFVSKVMSLPFMKNDTDEPFCMAGIEMQP